MIISPEKSGDLSLEEMMKLKDTMNEMLNNLSGLPDNDRAVAAVDDVLTYLHPVESMVNYRHAIRHWGEEEITNTHAGNVRAIWQFHYRGKDAQTAIGYSRFFSLDDKAHSIPEWQEIKSRYGLPDLGAYLYSSDEFDEEAIRARNAREDTLVNHLLSVVEEGSVSFPCEVWDFSAYQAWVKVLAEKISEAYSQYCQTFDQLGKYAPPVEFPLLFIRENDAMDDQSLKTIKETKAKVMISRFWDQFLADVQDKEEINTLWERVCGDIQEAA